MKENIKRFEKTSSIYSFVNMLIIICQISLWVYLIELMHGDFSIYFKIPVLLLFVLVMQGIFSMMHECTHSVAFKNKRLNYIVGCFISIPFCMHFSLYSAYHKSHHSRNRSRTELADVIFPGESRRKKIIIYYFAIIGGLWVLPVVASIILPLLPLSFVKKLRTYKSTMTYVHIFDLIDSKKWTFMRLELISAIIFWWAAISFFQWNWQTLAVSYAALAFSWSSLQWIYHIRTPFHVMDGALDLKLPRILSLLILNFNYHLTHHRYPKIPWNNLKNASETKSPESLWLRYVKLFRPPQPIHDLSIIEKIKP